MGSYVPGHPEVSAEFGGAWVENHGVLLPLDGRVFPAAAQVLLTAGKFERGLARRLPAVLPKGGAVLEIGSAVGFLGLHLAKARPDLRITLQEDNLALRQVMQRIMEKNGRQFSDRLSLWQTPLGDAPVEPVLALMAATRPQALLLADPRLTPGVLAELLPRLAPRPEQLVVYGRLLESWHGGLGPVEALLADLGYEAALRFDPGIAKA
jgi:hypothetical protein